MTARRTLADMMREETTADGMARVYEIRRAAPLDPDEERDALAVLRAMQRREGR